MKLVREPIERRSGGSHGSPRRRNVDTLAWRDDENRNRPEPEILGKGSTGFAVSLESVPAAGGEARRHLAGLADRLSTAAFGGLRTVVSELVNNCVVHASGGPIELSIEHTLSGLIHGSVSDGGMGPMEISAPRVGEGGCGLAWLTCSLRAGASMPLQATSGLRWTLRATRSTDPPGR